MKERKFFRRMRIRTKDNSGIILIIVLWVLMILVLLVIGLSRRTAIDVALMKFSIGQIKAKYLALSGFMFAKAKISETGNQTDTLAHCGIQLKEGQTAEDIFKRAEQDDGYFEVFYDRFGEEDSPAVRYGPSDETCRINLNALTYNNYKILYYLIVQEGFDMQTAETIASAVIDWRDSDDNDFNNPYGAEESYYSTLEEGYHCKNWPMESVEEFLLIKGVTQEIYEAVKNFLTVFPEKGTLRVNFNTASKPVLLALAKSFLGIKVNASEADAESLVEKIILHRRGDDGIEGNEDDQRVVVKDLSLNEKERDLFILMSSNQTETTPYLRIKVKGVEERSGASSVIEAVVDRNNLSVASWRRRQ